MIIKKKLIICFFYIYYRRCGALACVHAFDGLVGLGVNIAAVCLWGNGLAGSILVDGLFGIKVRSGWEE